MDQRKEGRFHMYSGKENNSKVMNDPNPNYNHWISQSPPIRQKGNIITTTATTTLSHPPIQKVLHSSESVLWREYERIKVILKERELSLIKANEENSVLKQIERRHQRELAELELQQQEAPRIIQGLRDEVQGLKHKLKDTYTFQATQDRRIRLLAEQLDQAKKLNLHLQELTSHNDLRVRSQLQEEVELLRNQVMEHEEMCKELRCKCDLIDKNFTTESLNLRTKIRAIENENQLLKDKISQQEVLLRERDKDIASLSIYKYNALHRKPEPCKVCQKRQLEEKELKRRLNIMKLLPRLNKPIVTVINSSSVDVYLDLPPLSSYCQYDRVQLICSCKQDMSDARIYNNIQPGSPITMRVNDLPTGQFCFFRVIALYREFTSEPSEHETTFVDILPIAPSNPNITYQCIPGQSHIKVQVKIPSPHNGETAGKLVRVYQSNNGSSYYLAAEIPRQPQQTMVSYTITSPDIAVPYWFTCSIINELGESPQSLPSGPITLDYPPLPPIKPIVKRYDLNSIQVSIIPSKNRGESGILTYRVLYHTISEPDHGHQVEYKCNEVTMNGYVIVKGLDVGKVYIIAVAVKNASGWSELSAYSDRIHLEDMLPIPPPPQCIILSPSTVRCLMYSSHEQDKGPTVIGYKLWIARQHDMSDISTACPFIPVQSNMPSEFMLEDLELGGNYWISVSLLGTNQESGLSPPILICLATAIPLPTTPHPVSDTTTTKTILSPTIISYPPPSNLNRATSRSIDLSVAQRIQNLFRGNPAFAIPDDIRLQAQADGVQVIVTNGYMSPTFGKHRGSLESLSGSRKDLSITTTVTNGSNNNNILNNQGGNGINGTANSDSSNRSNYHVTTSSVNGPSNRVSNPSGLATLTVPASADKRRISVGISNKKPSLLGKRVSSRAELLNRH